MAALDSSVPQVYSGAAAVQITDGSNTVTIAFEGSFSWTRTGRQVVEARSRDRHKSTPVIVETGDSDISISMEGNITSFLGSSNTYVYEALTKTGNAAAWTSTGAGNAYTFRLVYTCLSGAAGGGSQTLTFNYCHCDQIAIDPGGDDGKTSFSATITDYENDPTIA